MPRLAKPMEFDLTPQEAAYILDTPVSGEGGRQSFQRQLQGQLEAHPYKVSLDDSQVGRLCRYIAEPEGGGNQNRLRNAFGRSLREKLGL